MGATIRDMQIKVIRRDVPGGSLSAEFGAFGGEVEIGVLRLIADDGLEGNTIVGTYNRGGQAFFEPIIKTLKPLLIGQDVAAREWLWNRFWSHLGQLAYRSRIPTAAWATVDVAMWDLAGKAAGMPVFEMLGAQRNKVKAYATSPYYPELERYVEEAKHFQALGYAGYKVHPGTGAVDRSRKLATMLRDAVGPDMALMMDSSQLLTFQSALQIGRTLDELDFVWFEDPIRYTDIGSLIELSKRLDLPLAMTDHADFRFFEAVPFVQWSAARIIRGDSLKLGITGLKKLATLCEAFGLNLEVHHGGNSLMNAANLNVVMAIANCDYYEVLLPMEANQFGLIDDIRVDNEGYVHAPTRPGLGFELDWELFNRLTVRVL